MVLKVDDFDQVGCTGILELTLISILPKLHKVLSLPAEKVTGTPLFEREICVMSSFLHPY